MYLKPNIYRGFSIFHLVSGILGLISAISAVVSYSRIINSDRLFGFISLDFLSPDLSSAISVYTGIVSFVLIITALLSLFFSYMEFSSMFQFADLIEHDQNGQDVPLRKRPFVFPPKVYQNFGLVIFSINIVCLIIVSIVLIISKSIVSEVFVAVPLIPLAIISLNLLVIYITYYMRYKAFGDVLEVATEADQKNPSVLTKENLKENKTGVLRGWGTFLFVCCFLVTITLIIGIILIIRFLPEELHFGLIFSLVLSWIITIITYSITSCYYDNLAMMLERKLIKYDLITNRNKSVKCSNCKRNVSGDANYCSVCGTKTNK